jgi:hypothetical protein
VDLFFISSGRTQYLGPVTDPLFFTETGDNIIEWTPNRPVSVLGCTEQHQFCNPNVPQNSGCTPLTNFNGAAKAAQKLPFNAWQSNVAKRLVGASSFTTLSTYLATRRVSALAATELVQLNPNPYSPALPANQWTTEVTGWHMATMAMLQELLVESTTGPSNTSAATEVQRPDSKEGLQICDSQKIRRTDYSSFNLAALVVVIVLGGLIICTNMCLSLVTGHIQRRKDKGDHRRLAWILDSTLQLQRMAHEGQGIGSWSGGAGEVPITQYGERLGIVSPSDPDHPTLVKAKDDTEKADTSPALQEPESSVVPAQDITERGQEGRTSVSGPQSQQASTEVTPSQPSKNETEQATGPIYLRSEAVIEPQRGQVLRGSTFSSENQQQDPHRPPVVNLTSDPAA